jgi:hypothetical protein
MLRPFETIATCVLSSVGCFLRIGAVMCAKFVVRLANERWARREERLCPPYDSVATLRGQVLRRDAQLCRQGTINGRRDAEGKNKEALRRSHFTLFFRQVICPTGSCGEFLSSPSAK